MLYIIKLDKMQKKLHKDKKVFTGRQVVFENKKRTKCTHKKYIMYIKSIQNVHKMYIKKHIIL